MKVFVTGATGFVGSAIVRELLQAGHQVLGLVRSAKDAESLTRSGAKAHIGNLNDLESLRIGAAASDGVIHTAFNHDFSQFKQSCENDRHIITTFGEVLAGTERPLIVTSALGLLPQGRLVTEQDIAVAGPNPRLASEEAADVVAGRGVRISVVRLPPSVHGDGDHGFIPMLIEVARKQGISVFEDEGLNYWSAVHQLDAAKLYRLALEKAAPGGTRYHAVDEEGIAFRYIAEAIGKGLGIPVVSKSKEEAAANFGWFAHFAAMDIRASGHQTQQELKWSPLQPGLIADMESGSYFSA
ncbi:SDR family oxidoreductase [Pedobacter cryoconitis]|uniref:Nucleoside-diphosphate-sugar epimerase n=1 Tax=Pedobacter cryoconitis TaxID=188932 RepID=A0A7X0MHZ6_9SPHI|nr:SDR family oxidoreductase [Pedobacter cryoconitis]MBB6499847.1 nucleoside-diphosphate-sugar epimerase [Pedobacter cryoconitis]